ncbi:hypothetical protein Tco_0582878 [Tanacetum coccineum]
MLLTHSNLATGPSTKANVPTVSVSLDDTNGNQTNDTANLDKHLSVDSPIATNVGVEAGKSNESFGHTSNVVTPRSNPSNILKHTMVVNEPIINEGPSSYTNTLRL